MRMVLFDIDGTLLRSGGAATRSLNLAFQVIYGIESDSTSVQFDGKTDPLIIRELMQEYELAEPPNEKLLDTYLSILTQEIRESRDFEILSGARELLSCLSIDPEFLVGLGTGNIEEGARLKLERAELNSFFAFGGYGSDSGDRTELIRIAIGRGRDLITPHLVDEIFVIGDTPRDIRHGRAAGARTVAVATGNFSLEELEAYNPDLAVVSLEPKEPILDFLLS